MKPLNIVCIEEGNHSGELEICCGRGDAQEEYAIRKRSRSRRRRRRRRRRRSNYVYRDIVTSSSTFLSLLFTAYMTANDLEVPFNSVAAIQVILIGNCI